MDFSPSIIPQFADLGNMEFSCSIMQQFVVWPDNFFSLPVTYVAHKNTFFRLWNWQNHVIMFKWHLSPCDSRKVLPLCLQNCFWTYGPRTVLKALRHLFQSHSEEGGILAHYLYTCCLWDPWVAEFVLLVDIAHFVRVKMLLRKTCSHCGRENNQDYGGVCSCRFEATPRHSCPCCGANRHLTLPSPPPNPFGALVAEFYTEY